MLFLKCNRFICKTNLLKLGQNRLLRPISTTTSHNALWYEKDPKGGYKTSEKVNNTQLIREGLKELKNEIKLWTQEMKEAFEMDPIVIDRPGETDVIWRLNTEESLKKWVVTCDSDHSEGFSKCDFNLTEHGNALFSGELCTKVPKDGRIQRSGYCNIKSMRKRKSFKRDAFHDWSNYNMLVLKVRGDGRNYMLNLSTTGYYDVLWNDVYHYVLFTRGGPYWQITKIPFSKFFLSSKGRIQDKQQPIPLHSITNFGITLSDKIEGPFHLEIDYIGLEFDPSHTEEFAYEMYKTDNYITAN